MNTLCRMLPLCLLAILSVACVNARSKHGNPHFHHGHPRGHHDLCISMWDLDQIGESMLQPFIRKHMHWERYPAVYLVPQLEDNQKSKRKRRKREQGKSCPNLRTSTPSSKAALHERSISPWSYRINYDENRYPQRLAFAECLCYGCIESRSGKEIHSLKSVKVYQTMMVLRRKPCPTNSKTFTYELDYEKIPVGCTCASPKY